MHFGRRYILYVNIPTLLNQLESNIRLSDAFPQDIAFEPSLELVVTRFNIGYNDDINKCSRLHQYKPIRDYSFFVHDVRRRVDAGESLGDALTHRRLLHKPQYHARVPARARTGGARNV